MEYADYSILRGTEDDPQAIIYFTLDEGITIERRLLGETVFIALGADDKEKLTRVLNQQNKIEQGNTCAKEDVGWTL